MCKKLSLILQLLFFWNVAECMQHEKTPFNESSSSSSMSHQMQACWKCGAMNTCIAEPDNAKKNVPKKSPIRAIKDGETMLSITLTIVEDNTVYATTKGMRVWSLVGSDGVDFITIAIWEEHLDDFIRQLGNDFMGKTFRFTNFYSIKLDPTWNLGSVGLNFRPSEEFTVVPIEIAAPLATYWDYYAFLEKKHGLDSASFDPKPLWEAVSDIEVKLVQIIDHPKNFGLFLDIKVEDDDGGSAIIQAKHVYARFLYNLLRGKEGAILRFHGLHRMGKSRTFVFGQVSKIAVVNSGVPVLLRDLSGRQGSFQMNIRLKVGQPQTSKNTPVAIRDGTVCHDGKNKAQFLFPKGIKFDVGDEFTVKQGEVKWSASGVLTVNILRRESNIARHYGETLIEQMDLLDLEYP